MPPEPGSPGAWLRHARSDLALARIPASDELLRETLCFHAQQAVEKSIKAVLVARSIPFPRVHSVERLIDLLPQSVQRSEELVASAGLTAYATTFRYPGAEEPVTEEEYREAVRLADAVVAWAEDCIQQDSKS